MTQAYDQNYPKYPISSFSNDVAYHLRGAGEWGAQEANNAQLAA